MGGYLLNAIADGKPVFTFRAIAGWPSCNAANENGGPMGRRFHIFLW
jgi:hypothetical protein